MRASWNRPPTSPVDDDLTDGERSEMRATVRTYMEPWLSESVGDEEIDIQFAQYRGRLDTCRQISARLYRLHQPRPPARPSS